MSPAPSPCGGPTKRPSFSPRSAGTARPSSPGSTYQTRKTTGGGVLPGTALDPRVLANSTHAVASTDPDATVWWLIDVEQGNAWRLPDLDDTPLHGPITREARALVFGPEDFAAVSGGKGRYVVPNTATGAITTTVAQVKGQYYAPPTLAPDLRTTAIGSSGPDTNELWLLNLVDDGLVVIPDHLGAQFSPDGRAFLTREVRRDAPIEIRAMNGDPIRDLAPYDRGWWLG